MKSQNEVILAALRSGRHITSAWAFHELYCTRLSARIHDLRADGVPVQMYWKKKKSKRTGRISRFAVYFLGS